MKRLTLVLALVMVLGLFLAVPAVAQEGDECAHAGATIADLRACVLHAYEQGHITHRGVLNTLLRQLDAAQAAYDAGDTDRALDLLDRFIDKVEAEAGLTIDEQHAQHIITHGEAVVQALEQ